MDSYTISLGIIQVIILSTMFAVLKKYGKKGLLKYGAGLLALVGITAFIVSSNKKSEKVYPIKEKVIQKTNKIIVKPTENKTISKAIKKDEPIIYPKDKHICDFGMEFYNNKGYKKAYQVFKKGYEQKDYCSTVWYGTMYYNGIYVKKDYARGGEIWMEAYDMVYDKFDSDINYNVGIYQDYVLRDYKKSRYHHAIAAKSGDKDSIRILKTTNIIKDITASDIFFKEIVRFENKEIDYDLIQKRFNYFENKDKSWEYTYYFKPFRYDKFKKKDTKIIIAKKYIEITAKSKKGLENILKKLADVIYIDTHKSIEKTEDFIITKSKEKKQNLFKIKLEINFDKKSKYPPIIGKLHTNKNTDICKNKDIAKILDGAVIARYCNRKTQKPITGTYISEYFGYRDIQKEIKDGYDNGIEYQFNKDGTLSNKTMYKQGLENGIFIDYWDTGKIRYTGNYTNGKYDGVVKHYNYNETKNMEISYKDGKTHGESFIYSDNGKLETTIKFKDGKVLSGIEYKNGKKSIMKKSSFNYWEKRFDR